MRRPKSLRDAWQRSWMWASYGLMYVVVGLQQAKHPVRWLSDRAARRHFAIERKART